MSVMAYQINDNSAVCSNALFSANNKETSKLKIIGILWGGEPVTCRFAHFRGGGY